MSNEVKVREHIRRAFLPFPALWAIPRMVLLNFRVHQAGADGFLLRGLPRGIALQAYVCIGQKYFAAAEGVTVCLCRDENGRGRACSGRRTINFRAEKVSPNSTPEVSPDGLFGGDNGAIRSVGKVTENVV
jgi:hypothetical protein